MIKYFKKSLFIIKVEGWRSFFSKLLGKLKNHVIVGTLIRLPAMGFRYSKRMIIIIKTDGFRYFLIVVLARLNDSVIPMAMRWLSRQQAAAEVIAAPIVQGQLPFPATVAKRKSNALALRGLLTYQPLISIIMPVYNVRADFLKEAMESIIEQTYANWEFIICDDGSDKEETLNMLKQYESTDSRIKITYLGENRGIAHASNEAIDRASGEFCAFLDNDDRYHPDALIHFVRFLQDEKHRGIDICYTDESKIDEEGMLTGYTFHKPDFNKLLLLSVNYFCHLLIIRRTLLKEIGGFNQGFEGAQDYDLILRAISKTENVLHLPFVLYYWRVTETSTAATLSAKPLAYEAGNRALQSYCDGNKIAASAVDGRFPWYRVKFELLAKPEVAIIIPFKDKLNYLRPLLKSIKEKSTYKNYKIYLVNNQSQEPEALQFIKETEHTVIDFDKPFNFSLIYNEVTAQVSEELCLFMNNDMKVISEDWLECMIEHIQDEKVAAVGGLLFYANDLIQHAGIVTCPYHKVFAFNLSKELGGMELEMYLQQYVNAVTAACMLIKKRVFLEVGGFDTINFPIGFSDVDLCLRIKEAGYKIAYTPYAQLYHYESVSRKFNEESYEQFMLARKYLMGSTTLYDENRSRFSVNTYSPC